MRETQLIGNASIELEVIADDIPSVVRIVSLRENDCNNSEGSEVHIREDVEVCNPQELQHLNHSVADPEADNEASGSGNMWSEAERVDSFNGISSYEDFVEHIYLELKKIEDEVVTVLRFAGLVIESNEKLENSKIQQLLDILDSIQHIRERLERTIQRKMSFK
ncbi:unnamed protein product [Cuscuta epithymum]|uniref:Uncharacterized protein n=1 Tax=Cuscuta epithymum TaxID=186058 RepID=A0AAV0D728_9ASTE|nr:unnamed protein product [Cuscuta epithymum]